MYYIVEIQDTPGTSATLLHYTEETRNAAMSKFHNIMSYAAVSTVPYHTCVVMDEQGKYLARECYEHPVIPAQSTEETE